MVSQWREATNSSTSAVRHKCHGHWGDQKEDVRYRGCVSPVKLRRRLRLTCKSTQLVLGPTDLAILRDDLRRSWLENSFAYTDSYASGRPTEYPSSHAQVRHGTAICTAKIKLRTMENRLDKNFKQSPFIPFIETHSYCHGTFLPYSTRHIPTNVFFALPYHIFMSFCNNLDCL